MPDSFQCPSCGQGFAFRPQLGGRQGRCWRCGTLFSAADVDPARSADAPKELRPATVVPPHAPRPLPLPAWADAPAVPTPTPGPASARPQIARRQDGAPASVAARRSAPANPGRLPFTPPPAGLLEGPTRQWRAADARAVDAGSRLPLVEVASGLIFAGMGVLAFPLFGRQFVWLAWASRSTQVDVGAACLLAGAAVFWAAVLPAVWAARSHWRARPWRIALALGVPLIPAGVGSLVFFAANVGSSTPPAPSPAPATVAASAPAPPVSPTPLAPADQAGPMPSPARATGDAPVVTSAVDRPNAALASAAAGPSRRMIFAADVSSPAPATAAPLTAVATERAASPRSAEVDRSDPTSSGTARGPGPETAVAGPVVADAAAPADPTLSAARDAGRRVEALNANILRLGATAFGRRRAWTRDQMIQRFGAERVATISVVGIGDLPDDDPARLRRALTGCYRRLADAAGAEAQAAAAVPGEGAATLWLAPVDDWDRLRRAVDFGTVTASDPSRRTATIRLDPAAFGPRPAAPAVADAAAPSPWLPPSPGATTGANAVTPATPVDVVAPAAPPHVAGPDGETWVLAPSRRGYSAAFPPAFPPADPFTQMDVQYGVARVARLSFDTTAVLAAGGTVGDLAMRERIKRLAAAAGAKRTVYGTTNGKPPVLALGPVDDWDELIAAIDFGTVTASDAAKRTATVRLDPAAFGGGSTVP